jgi:hypothetical protein
MIFCFVYLSLAFYFLEDRINSSCFITMILWFNLSHVALLIIHTKWVSIYIVSIYDKILKNIKDNNYPSNLIESIGCNNIGLIKILENGKNGKNENLVMKWCDYLHCHNVKIDYQYLINIRTYWIVLSFALISVVVLIF